MAESFRRCSWRVEEDIHAAVSNGLVTINGPKATLWGWDRRARRYDQIDRLLKLKRQSAGPEVILIGESQTLIEQGLLPAESKIVVHVTPRSCQSCG